jgi:restriction system protein
MAIPNFQRLMLPLLRYLEDGRERSNQEICEALAEECGLTEQERDELLPTSRQPVFTNRVAWAKVHLKAARLIESPRRGVYKIAARGLEILRQKPERVDLRLLRTFAEYQEWRTPRPDGEVEKDEDALTPEEHLEYGYQKLRQDLASDLLRRVKDSSPAFFEKLVVDLLVAMGYGGSRPDAARTLGRSGDGGIDGVIKEDPLGLDVIYLQAKRWDGTIGRPEVQKFAGALQGQRARKGVFITTSDFSKDAEEYAANIDSRIVLINGPHLAALMIDYGVGVTRAGSYQVLRIDSDYFDES